MIYSRYDELLIDLGKNFNSARLNLKITGFKIDNNDIVTWIILRKESLRKHLLWQYNTSRTTIAKKF